MSFEDRLEVLRKRIESVDTSSHVKVVAVTKGFDATAIELASSHGLVDIGENYAQEAKSKYEAIERTDIRWHFIGRLQRNKVRNVAPFISLWQSVDSTALATEIAKRAPGAAILLQVDLAEIEGRGGCSFNDVEKLFSHAQEQGLIVRGLMGVGLPGDPEHSRKSFRRLRQTADALELTEVSMGMSGDLEVAIEEGSTMIRAGSALFGARTY